jgi:hypothetical protein
MLLEQDESLTMLEPDWRIFWDTARDVMWRHGIEVIDLHAFSQAGPPFGTEPFTSTPAAAVPYDSALKSQAAYVFGRIERAVDANDADAALARLQTRALMASAFLMGLFVGVVVTLGRNSRR